MTPGALPLIYDDRPNPLRRFYDEMISLQGLDDEDSMGCTIFGGLA